MPGISFTALEQMPDVIGTGRFELDVTPIPGLDRSFVQLMKLRCQQVDWVGVQVEQMTVGLHGHELNFRGRQVFSKQMATTFVETADGLTWGAIGAWKEAVVGTRSGNGGYRDDYAALVTLGVLDSTGKYVNSRRMFYVWPTDIQNIQLDGTQGSTAMLIQVTWSFDYAEDVGKEIDTHGTQVTI